MSVAMFKFEKLMKDWTVASVNTKMPFSRVTSQTQSLHIDEVAWFIHALFYKSYADFCFSASFIRNRATKPPVNESWTLKIISVIISDKKRHNLNATNWRPY